MHLFILKSVPNEESVRCLKLLIRPRGGSVLQDLLVTSPDSLVNDISKGILFIDLNFLDPFLSFGEGIPENDELRWSLETGDGENVSSTSSAKDTFAETWGKLVVLLSKIENINSKMKFVILIIMNV